MSESIEFRSVTHITAGTEGQPGNRVFFLQISDGERLVSVKLEKQQVQALAHYLRGVLDESDPPITTEGLEPLPIIEPIIPNWVVGQIAVGVDSAGHEVVLVIDELVEEEPDEMTEDLFTEDFFDSITDGARIRAHIKMAQAARFVATAEELMTKGRPPCRLCGQPVDPSGHACPRLN